MATKSLGKGTKKAAAKTTSAKRTKPGIKVTRNAITLTLSADQKKRMQACLGKSGRVTIGFREISVAKLPAALENGVLID